MTNQRRSLLRPGIEVVSPYQKRRQGRSVVQKPRPHYQRRLLVGKHLTKWTQPEALRPLQVILGAEWNFSVDSWNLGCVVSSLILSHAHAYNWKLPTKIRKSNLGSCRRQFSLRWPCNPLGTIRSRGASSKDAGTLSISRLLDCDGVWRLFW